MSRNLTNAYRPSVLVYHHVHLQGESKGRHGRDSVGIIDFERQARLLRERFNVISLAACLAAIEAGRPLPRRTVVITFDDGYRSTYTRAAPVLGRHALPACVFLATDSLADGPAQGGRPPSFHWLPASDDADESPMSWGEAKALSDAGIEIGSHTASHGFPPLMSRCEIEAELKRSKEKIASMLGRPPAALALPFSFPLADRRWPFFRANLLSALKKAAYSCCCTLQRGQVADGDGILFLPRITVMGGDSLRSFQAKALGLYRYTNLPQRIYQAFFKRYSL